MTDVLVGDIVEGTRLVSGAQVDVKATVRVVRVLDGALAPGTDIQLAWQYTALGPVRPVAGSLSGVHGLWFLRGVPGGFVILRAGELSEGGDYFLELPQGGSGAVIHLPDRSTESKIAVELAGALQTLAAQEPKGPARWQFRHLANALEDIDGKKTASVYQYLSLQPDANLKMLGIEGRLAAGDSSAVIELERDLPQLAHALYVRRAPPINWLNLAKNLPAAHAAARIALSEVTLPNGPGWEAGVVQMLALTRSLEFLPYLNVMLDSPRSIVRAGAVRAFCQLTKPSSFWQPGMQAQCPSVVGLGDTPEVRQAIDFWRSWYAGRRTEIATVASLPEVAAPARYSAERSRENVETPVEIRFLRLVSASAGVFNPPPTVSGDAAAVATPGHTVPARTATVHVGFVPPGSIARFIGELDPTDREIFHRMVDSIHASLHEIPVQDANSGGTPKPLAERQTLRQAVLQCGLADLRKQLSSSGWKAFQAEMALMAKLTTFPMADGRPAAPPR